MAIHCHRTHRVQVFPVVTLRSLGISMFKLPGCNIGRGDPMSVILVNLSTDQRPITLTEGTSFAEVGVLGSSGKLTFVKYRPDSIIHHHVLHFASKLLKTPKKSPREKKPVPARRHSQ